MTWLRTKLRAFRLLAALVMAVQPLVALSAPESHAASTTQVVIDGEVLVICTSRGAVTLDQRSTQPAQSDHKSSCPCCTAGCFAGCQGTAAGLIPETQALILRPVPVGPRAAPFSDVERVRIGLAAFFSRGPPLAAA